MNWSGVLLRIGGTENSKHVLAAVTPFLAETYVQRPCKKTFQQALHRVTSRNLFGNVETGLEMLFSSAPLLWTSTLAMNQSRVVVPFSDWFTQRSISFMRSWPRPDTDTVLFLETA